MTYSVTPIDDRSSVVFSYSPVVLSSVVHDPFTNSILVTLKSGSSLACRLGRAKLEGRLLWVFLRASLRSGSPVFLGVRVGWSSARWFCAASASAGGVSVAPLPAFVAGVPAGPLPFAPLESAPAPVVFGPPVSASSAWAW